MPRTDPTLCHPKNWLCRSECKPALDTSSHFTTGPHGDNADSPPNTRYKTTR